MSHLFWEEIPESETGEDEKAAVNHWMIDRHHLLTSPGSPQRELFRPPFFRLLFRPPLFFPPFLPPFFRGTFAPFLRASERPIAIACFRLFTFPPFPPRPLLSVPFFLRRMALPTRLLAAFPYFRPPLFFRPPFFAAILGLH
jgi:hypothetical protein